MKKTPQKPEYRDKAAPASTEPERIKLGSGAKRSGIVGSLGHIVPDSVTPKTKANAGGRSASLHGAMSQSSAATGPVFAALDPETIERIAKAPLFDIPKTLSRKGRFDVVEGGAPEKALGSGTAARAEGTARTLKPLMFDGTQGIAFLDGQPVSVSISAVNKDATEVSLLTDKEFREKLYLLLYGDPESYPNGIVKEPIDQLRDSLRRLGEFIQTSNNSEVFAHQARELVAEFATQVLGERGLRPKEADPVAAEIAAQVKIRWADRKLPENKGQPWTKGPVAFIRHWYGKWLDNGSLVRAHLQRDPQLYLAYANEIRRHADRALNLPTERRAHFDNPADALEHIRSQARETKRKTRLNKRSPRDFTNIL